MEKEGPQSEHGPAGRESNVVRLPRDWLGSRDELVPFGPRADRPASEPRIDSHGAVPDDRGGDPPSASDFWGEGSAAIQDALQAPPSGPLVERPDPSRRPRRTPPWHRRVSRAVQLRHLMEPEDSISKSRRNYAWLLLGAAATLVVIVASVGAQNGPRVRPKAPGKGGIANDLGDLAAGVGRIAHSKLRIADAAPRQKRLVRVPRRHASRGTRRSHRSAATAPTNPSTATATPVSISPSSGVAPSAGSPTASSPVVSSSDSGSAGGSSAGSSHSAGPVGRGAPFGPGTLG